jgi:hypothetical protein
MHAYVFVNVFYTCSPLSHTHTHTQEDELELLEWIMYESFPVFGAIGPDNYKEYVSKNLPIVWTFVKPTEDNFGDIQKVCV